MVPPARLPRRMAMVAHAGAQQLNQCNGCVGFRIDSLLVTVMGNERRSPG